MTDDTHTKIAYIHGIIALGWSNGNLSIEEEEMITDIINKDISFSDEQRVSLKNDIKNKITIDDYIKTNKDIYSTADVLNISETFFLKDGEYDNSEKEAYQKLHDYHMKKIGADVIKQSLIKDIDSLSNEWDDLQNKNEKEANQTVGIVSILNHYFRKITG